MAVKFEKTSDLRTHLSEAVHRAQDDAFNAALLADLGDRIGAFCDELKADGLGVSVSLCGRDFCIAIFQDAIDPPKDPAPMPEPVVETTAQSPEPEVLSTPEAAAPVVDDPATDTAPAREPKARPTAKSRGRKALFWTPEKTKELVRLKGAGKPQAPLA